MYSLKTKQRNICHVMNMSRDGAFVRAFVCHSVRFWPPFTLTVHINTLYNENVQLQEQNSSGINTIA